MSRRKLFLLHGFLGQTSDWSAVAEAIRAKSEFEPVPIDLYQEFADHESQRSLVGWARGFAARVQKEGGPKPVILGYSMGGRLALHALLEAPFVFDGGIFVSAHPGLRTPTEKAARVEHDRRWAQRFLENDWDAILDEWNSQAVLASSQEVDRSAQEPRRAIIAQALQDWSLGSQRDTRAELKRLTLPVLWMAGERDSRYVSLLKEVAAEGPATETRVIPGAGHRIPWDRPEEFAQAVCGFLSRF